MVRRASGRSTILVAALLALSGVREAQPAAAVREAPAASVTPDSTATAYRGPGKA